MTDETPSNQPPRNPLTPAPITPSHLPEPPSAALPPEPKAGSGGPADDKPSGWREAASTLGILLTALIVALLIIGFVFRSYQVDGPSMENTLQNSDKLIIWKVPRTWAKITGHNYIPKRGDIVVFTQSGLSDFGQQDKKQLIKRVIGLPGERVVIKDGAITIYNKQHPGGFNPDKTLAYFTNAKDIPTTSGDVDVTLRPGQIFVCGDNRPDSLDSRSFGPIQAKQIVGKLILRVFPINKAEAF
jgi:signal peptidase I